MQYKQKKRLPYLLITNNTDYKDRAMSANSARSTAPQHSPSKSGNRDVVQTELSSAERERMNEIVLRYQKYVPIRNEKRKEKVRSDVLDVDVLRAGLIRLVDADDETLYTLVQKARGRT